MLELLHPPVVHFAIVLPIVALALEGVWLITKEDAYSKAALWASVVATLFLVAAWNTGKIAGPDAYVLLDEVGKAKLAEHKNLGTVLALSMLVLAGIKVVAFQRKNRLLELIFAAAMTIFVLFVLLQGKYGGELVFDHAAGVNCPMEEL